VNNWFSVSPDNGVGNGRDYQWVTVTAERNPGDKRTGYIYLRREKPARQRADTKSIVFIQFFISFITF